MSHYLYLPDDVSSSINSREVVECDGVEKKERLKGHSYLSHFIKKGDKAKYGGINNLRVVERDGGRRREDPGQI